MADIVWTYRHCPQCKATVSCRAGTDVKENANGDETVTKTCDEGHAFRDWCWREGTGSDYDIPLNSRPRRQIHG